MNISVSGIPGEQIMDAPGALVHATRQVGELITKRQPTSQKRECSGERR